MAFTVDATWQPDPAHAGDQVTFIVSMDPSPPAGANVWVTVAGGTSPQLTTDPHGQASVIMPGIAAGSYNVIIDYATLPDADGDPQETNSVVVSRLLTVLPAPPAPPLPPSTPGAVPDLPDAQSIDASSAAGRSAYPGSTGDYGGHGNVDPFTGKQPADPYSGQPDRTDKSSMPDRIRAFYAQPSAVSDAVRNAVRDFYASPAIDLGGVPLGTRNAILDVYNQLPELPLPGRGIDDLLGDVIGLTLSDLDVAARITAGSMRATIGVIEEARDLGLNTTAQVLAPVLGATRAVAGVFEMVSGAGLTLGSEGLGAGVGVAIVAHGADEVVTGVRSMLGGEAQSITESVIKEVGTPVLGSKAALVAGGLNALISFGGSSAGALGSELRFEGTVAETGLSEVSGARPELAELSQLRDSMPVPLIRPTVMDAVTEAVAPVPVSRVEEVAASRMEQEIPRAPELNAPPQPARTEAAILFEARDRAAETARLLVQDELDSGRISEKWAEARYGTWLDALAKNNIRQAIEEGLLPDTFMVSPTIAINRGYRRAWINAPDVWDTASRRAWDFMPASEKSFFAHEDSYLGTTATARLNPDGTTIIEINPIFHLGFR